ncbi:MAG: transporter [Roseateles depolymerans]|uniref:Transporter n=1 Tax=Roseateles depolymerans TaxID=76731 RepID=A0A2W5DFF6_9BURK|nr:MAG: transporter [Roseateles depolymerans]
MWSTLGILLPLFALMAAGFIARRQKVLDGHAAGVLNAFVVWLSLPALLFEVTATSAWSVLWQPGFIAAFGLATALVFAAVLGLRLRAGRHLADASVDAVAASYSNTAYVGLPLCLLVFGQGSQVEATIATLIVVCVLFSLAVVLIEVGLQAEGRLNARTLRLALVRSLKNPLVAASILGGLFSGLGVTLPAAVQAFLKLIGQAATPCALVCLGAFLADRPRSAAGRLQTPLLLSGVKLFAMPLLTWVFAQAVFHLPVRTVHCAVLLAALPTGTGPFMLAEFYRREAGVTSSATLITTLLSLLTLTVLLVAMA